MTVEINGEERFFNDNAAKLDDKINPTIKIFYYIYGNCPYGSKNLHDFPRNMRNYS